MVRSSIGASRRQHDVEQRATKRLPIVVPAQMVWRDDRGATHLVDAETKDVSKSGVFVRCLGGSAIPLYRLVNFQIARAARARKDLPRALRRPRVLAAIYRIGPYEPLTGVPDSYALRLMVKPDGRRRLPDDGPAVSRATDDAPPCGSAKS